jgi:hypothetical protein
VGENGSGNPEVRGPATSAGPEPLFALLTVESVPYQGVDLAPFVDEYLKTNVPEGFPAEVQRKQISIGGIAAEMLEPVPGRLSSRVVFVDYSPQHFFIFTFWPSFADTPAGQVNAEGQLAQRDMDRLFELVAATFAGLPPAGVEMAPDWRVEVAESCLPVGRPLYIDTNDRYCFAFPAGLAGDGADRPGRSQGRDVGGAGRELRGVARRAGRGDPTQRRDSWRHGGRAPGRRAGPAGGH